MVVGYKADEKELMDYGVVRLMSRIYHSYPVVFQVSRVLRAGVIASRFIFAIATKSLTYNSLPSPESLSRRDPCHMRKPYVTQSRNYIESVSGCFRYSLCGLMPAVPPDT